MAAQPEVEAEAGDRVAEKAGAPGNLLHVARWRGLLHGDALLLLNNVVRSTGYDGPGDFMMDPLGRLSRRPERVIAPFVFTGVQLVDPRLFHGAPQGAFSMNVLYDRAAEAERLFGIAHDGEWFHVGTPAAVKEAESEIMEREGSRVRRLF